MAQIVLLNQSKQALKRIRDKEKHKQLLQPSVKMQPIKEEGKDRKKKKRKKRDGLYKTTHSEERKEADHVN